MNELELDHRSRTKARHDGPLECSVRPVIFETCDDGLGSKPVAPRFAARSAAAALAIPVGPIGGVCIGQFDRPQVRHCRSSTVGFGKQVLGALPVRPAALPWTTRLVPTLLRRAPAPTIGLTLGAIGSAAIWLRRGRRPRNALPFFGSPGLVPKLTRDLDRVDAGLLPPGALVNGAMKRPVMDAAERHREFVACFAAEHPRLHKPKVMGSTSSGRKAGRVAGRQAKVLPVAVTTGRRHREPTLVDAVGLVATRAATGSGWSVATSARGVRSRLPCLPSGLCVRDRQRGRGQEPMFERLLHKLRIIGSEPVLGGQCALRPACCALLLIAARRARPKDDPVTQPIHPLRDPPRPWRPYPALGSAVRAYCGGTAVAGPAELNPRSGLAPSLPPPRGRGRGAEIGRIEVVLAGDADQGEQGIAAA